MYTVIMNTNTVLRCFSSYKKAKHFQAHRKKQDSVKQVNHTYTVFKQRR